MSNREFPQFGVVKIHVEQPLLMLLRLSGKIHHYYHAYFTTPLSIPPSIQPYASPLVFICVSVCCRLIWIRTKFILLFDAECISIQMCLRSSYKPDFILDRHWNNRNYDCICSVLHLYFMFLRNFITDATVVNLLGILPLVATSYLWCFIQLNYI